MKAFRAVLFWTHLIVGAVAGVVILVMSVTGVLLTYEKQMIEWADRRQSPVVAPSPGMGTEALPPETLLAAVAAAQPGATVAGLTSRADPAAPATVLLAANRSVLVDPYTGAVLGEPAPGLRSFFRAVTNWHRWMALEGASRATGRAITGAANLGFLFVVVSGLYLWVPRLWTRLQFTQVLWFRRGLAPKARDFNWHNVFGIWSAIPLAVVVAGAVPISYSWASALVYRMAGEEPPAPPTQAGRPSGAAAGRAGGPGRAGRPAADPEPVAISGLDAAWTASQTQVPSWRSMTARFSGPPDAPFVISLDRGHGGQPQLRSTLTIDRATGNVIKAETFDDLGPGRRARSWLRFAHTGEYYGLPGQTIAGLVSAGGAVLVYTGIALALRRWSAWRRRRTLQNAALAAAYSDSFETPSPR
ncbi:MAG: PepSY domain-containing protein [Acidobacteria bacterium]|nr:PepSY domain-containing protein [Acidobacteriota bacterium]